jgi:hypothetical protein
MSIIDQHKKSGLSLDGTRGFSKREFGYVAPGEPVIPYLPTNKLHNTYSVDSKPSIKVVDFNGSIPVRPESTLDELDAKAPKNLQAGKEGSVVSKIYNSSKGNNYKDLGPTDGRF